MKRQNLTSVLLMLVAVGLGTLGCAKKEVAPGATVTPGIVFDNGAPDFGPPATSDLGPGNFVDADDFVLPAGATSITEVTWYGGYAGNRVRNVDDFTIRIFEDADGSPAQFPTVLDLHVEHVSRTQLQDDENELSTFEYRAAISPVTLGSGTTYYLSIANNAASTTGIDWAWNASTTDTEKVWTRRDDAGDWSRPGALGRSFLLIGQ